jgi:hypothetical protein
VDRRGAEILLRLFKEYTFEETFVHLAGKRGEVKGQWFSQADLDGDLFAEVVPESYLPQTNLERRQRWRALLMDVWGLPGLKMAIDQMPSLIEQLSELYDVDLGSDDFSNVRRNCAASHQANGRSVANDCSDGCCYSAYATTG